LTSVSPSPAHSRRGRPRKFNAPSRAVTLTLPEQVIATLAAIDGDLGRAIVRLAQPELARQPHPPAELSRFGRRAVIVVNPTPTLARRTGVELIPLPDGRALIAFERATTIPALELMIADALDDPKLSAADAETFRAIGDILKSVRRSSDLILQQRNIIVVEARRPQAAQRRRRMRARKARVGA
jgi:hypothetical protein